MAGPPRNPAYRAQLYKGDSVAVGETAIPLVEDYCVANFARITGTARSNQAVTLTIYQGPEAGRYDYKSTVSVSADASEGAGAAISVEVVGEYCKITAVRTSSSDSDAFQAGIYARAN